MGVYVHLPALNVLDVRSILIYYWTTVEDTLGLSFIERLSLFIQFTTVHIRKKLNFGD